MTPTDPTAPDAVEVIEVHPVAPWLPAATRAWLYRLALVLALALAAGGRIASEDLRPWLDVLAVLLGVGGSGLAAVHTPRANTRTISW